MVFDGMLLEFSPLLRLAERNLVTAFTRSDKLEVGAIGCWVNDIRQLHADVSSPRQVIGLMDGQTDGWLFSFIDCKFFLTLKYQTWLKSCTEVLLAFKNS